MTQSASPETSHAPTAAWNAVQGIVRDTVQGEAFGTPAQPHTKIAVVCDNTMGILGGEIDDGLALLYLLGMRSQGVEVALVCTTHGNAPTEQTHRATCNLCGRLFPAVHVARGSDTPLGGAGRQIPRDSPETGDASEAAADLVRLAWENDPRTVELVSLGAVTDLALAERMRPGTLARFASVNLMGGILRTLVLGGRIMGELNFSVDAEATHTVLAAAQSGARLRIADAQDCLALFVDADTFLTQFATRQSAGVTDESAAFVRQTCVPWIERMRDTWAVNGFVCWDVLAAAACLNARGTELVPYRVTLNTRFLETGLLEQAGDDVPDHLCADVCLVRVANAATLISDVYHAWRRGLSEAFGADRR